MLHIVTDGAADMPPEWEEKYQLHTVPINIQFGEKTYLQFVDLDFEDFYDKVEETQMVPKTSQPTPHQFVAFYRKIAQKGETILSIHVTGKLSGTYESAVLAAKELKDEFNIIPFDSAGGSMGLGFMCRISREMDRAGKNLEEILAYLENIKDKVQIILTLDTLEYAKMSGRVGAMSAALASVLNVKPIAVLKDGIVEMVAKVRTRKAAFKRIIEMGKEAYGDQEIYFGVLHARDRKAGENVLEAAQKVLNIKEAFLTDLTLSIATNFGPGTVGIVLYPAE